MLCSGGGLGSALHPFVDFYFPARSLWPEVRPLLRQQELQLLHRDVLQELRSGLDMMDRVQRRILQNTEPLRSGTALQPLPYQLDKDGRHYDLTLDTRGFSPEQLSVRQVGRKLRVSGKAETKEEDGRGSYSYRLQEFRQEFQLPQGVDPEGVSCCLTADGKLHIQAVREEEEEAGRELTIKRSGQEEEEIRQQQQKQQEKQEQQQQ